MPDQDRFEHTALGITGPLTRYARIAVSNGDPLPFKPRAILFVASGQARVYFKDGSSAFIDFGTGELAPNIWHPMRCELIENNDVEIVIAD